MSVLKVASAVIEIGVATGENSAVTPLLGATTRQCGPSIVAQPAGHAVVPDGHTSWLFASQLHDRSASGRASISIAASVAWRTHVPSSQTSGAAHCSVVTHGAPSGGDGR